MASPSPFSACVLSTFRGFKCLTFVLLRRLWALLRMPLPALVLCLSWVLSTGADGGSFIRADTAYYEAVRGKLAVYHGEDVECNIVGHRRAAEKILSSREGHHGHSIKFNRVVPVTERQMKRVLARCQSLHASLYSTDPKLFLATEEEEEEKSYKSNDVGGDIGWKDRMDNNLAIYKKLEKKRKREKQLSNSIWGWNFLNRILIMPGTKWCGQGDIAEHFNDLGYHGEVDKCCR